MELLRSGVVTGDRGIALPQILGCRKIVEQGRKIFGLKVQHLGLKIAFRKKIRILSTMHNHTSRKCAACCLLETCKSATSFLLAYFFFSARRRPLLLRLKRMAVRQLSKGDVGRTTMSADFSGRGLVARQNR